MIDVAARALDRALPARFTAAVIEQLHRRHEPEIAAVVQKCPRRGTAVDVGAWYGPWTRPMARRVDTVVSFEPNPPTAARLRRGVPPNVVVIEAAVSDHEHRASLHVPADGRGDGLAALRQTGGADQEVSVRCVALDDMGLSDVTLLKIDVEGTELDVLRGATELLRRWQPVVVVEVEYRHGDQVDETLSFLRDSGYELRVLTDGWQPLDDVDLRDQQRRSASRLDGTGYIRGVVRRGERYVNNVVGASPGSTWSPWAPR